VARRERAWLGAWLGARGAGRGALGAARGGAWAAVTPFSGVRHSRARAGPSAAT